MSANNQVDTLPSQTTSVSEYPRLRHCTLVERGEDEVMMVVGQEYFTISQLLGSKEKFLEVKSYFDGRHSIGEISRLTGVSADDVREVVEAFIELDLMRQEEPLDLIPVESFVRRVEDSCVMWKRQVGYHRLYQMLSRGEAHKRVFLGLIQETYHYVLSAPKHISVAISHCKDPQWEKLLNLYFVEEFNHSDMILNTLVNLGVDRRQATEAHPIIGTMSLINMLCEIARNSTLAYIACTRLFEALPEDFEQAKVGMEKMAETYGFSADTVQPMIDHMRGDVVSEHSSLLREALRSREFIEAEEAHYAVNCLHDLKHSYDQFHDQVIQYYSDISNYVPRLKVDYFSL